MAMGDNSRPFWLQLTLIDKIKFESKFDEKHVSFDLSPNDLDLSWIQLFKKQQKFHDAVRGSPAFGDLRITDYRSNLKRKSWKLQENIGLFVNEFPSSKQKYYARFCLEDINISKRSQSRPSPTAPSVAPPSTPAVAPTPTASVAPPSTPAVAPPSTVSAAPLTSPAAQFLSLDPSDFDDYGFGIMHMGPLPPQYQRRNLSCSSFDSQEIQPCSSQGSTETLPISSNDSTIEGSAMNNELVPLSTADAQRTQALRNISGLRGRTSRLKSKMEEAKVNLRNLSESSMMRANPSSDPSTMEVVNLSSPEQGNSLRRQRPSSPEIIDLAESEVMGPPPPPPPSRSSQNGLKRKPNSDTNDELLLPPKKRSQEEPESVGGGDRRNLNRHIQLPGLRASVMANNDEVSSVVSLDSLSDVVRGGGDPNLQIKNQVMRRLDNMVDNNTMLRVRMELLKIYKSGGDKWMRLANKIPLTTNVLQMAFFGIDNDGAN